MSTRCQIMIEGSPILIYKHSDGYPEGVMPTLEPFIKMFFENRGFEIDYLTAQIIREFAIKEYLSDETWLSRPTVVQSERYTYEKRRRTLGWGIDQEIHGDIEYLYYIRKTGIIEIRIPNNKCTVKTVLKNSKLYKAEK